MRITESIVYKLMAHETLQAQANMEKAGRPLMTGRRFTRPSEDPVFADRTAKMERDFTKTTQLLRNIDRTKGYYGVVDATLQSVGDVLINLQTLAISQANDLLGANERLAGAAEAKQLADTLAGFANGRLDGKYLFAGRLENTAPYDPALNFVGDAIGRKVQIGESIQIDAHITGAQIFGNAALGDVTAFQAAQNLITALNANDTAGITSALAELNSSHERLTVAQAKVGSRLSELQSTEFLLGDVNVARKKRYATLANVDIAKAASELAFAEYVLQASVDTAKQMNRSLFKNLFN
jgi:flagellar hook-associated protein 3 FlgL